MHRYVPFTLWSAVLVGVSGCSAIQANPGAEQVRLVMEQPTGSCRFIAEVSGSQGNFFSGNYTSTENLLLGARNDLRNKAAAVGANVVYMQESHHSQASDSLGTTNTTLIGHAYRCN
ncbi:DUF4156 domain-containing protein [Balneatrix alpica]|uniref:DUF4156 domain-containing protein n=1 Tax=Balneatrix alpica TaxID=75684 RepID=A0ABV5ZF40_9GAMM|nr:DUF4156 domain-containing protein [Balneatrix alpica]